MSKKPLSRLEIINTILGVALVLSLGANIWLFTKVRPNKNLASLTNLSAETVSADEIYPMFLCPCCGQPLDKNNICCGMAKEMIDYIDSLVAQKLPKDEIILSFVKKYGSNSFVDKNKREEYREKLIATAPADRPIIFVSPESYNLSDVSQRKGIATTLFNLKNEGRQDLIIDKLDTSCGCTSASIIYKGVEGPRFAMAGHGIESPTDWSVTIPSGESAQLKVYYDPDVHKDFRGPAIREIYIYSNDPIDFEKEVRIELNQVD